jgi:hypothetical protein
MEGYQIVLTCIVTFVLVCYFFYATLKDLKFEDFDKPRPRTRPNRR